MTYAALITKDNIESNYLIKLRVKKYANWTQVGATDVYYSDVNFLPGVVDAFYSSGVKFTLGVSTLVSVGEYYVDAMGFVYMNKGGGWSNSVIHENIFLATSDQDWYVTPTDIYSGYAFYRGVVIETPTIKSGTSENIFGYMPRQTTSFSFANDNYFFNRYLDIDCVSSFYRAKVEVFHALGNPLNVSNISKIYTGFVESHESTNTKVSFSLTDSSVDLKGTYLPKPGENEGNNFYEDADIDVGLLDCYPASRINFVMVGDSGSVGNPIREIFGRVTDLKVNTWRGFSLADDKALAYYCGGDLGYNKLDYNASGFYYHQTTVVSGTSATETVVLDASGFCSQDVITFSLSDAGAGLNMAYVTIYTVDYSTNTITHSSSGSAIASGQYIYRSFIGRLVATPKGESVSSSGAIKIPFCTEGLPVKSGGANFTNTFGYVVWIIDAATDADYEYLTGFRIYPQTPASDFDIDGTTEFGNHDVYASVYGIQDPSVSSKNGYYTNNLSYLGPVLYHIMTERLNILSEDMDTSSFFDLEEDGTDLELGISIPENNGGEHPTFEDVINKIIKTGLLKLFYTIDGKWTLSRVKYLPATMDESITNEDTLLDSKKIRYDYQDLYSDVAVKYRYSESEDYSILTNYSAIGKFLHGVSRQLIWDTLLIHGEHVVTLLFRLTNLFGNRRKTLQITTKNAQTNTIVDAAISYTDAKAEGYTYDPEVDRTINYVLTNISKSENQTVLTLDDQAGVENSSPGTF